MILNIGIGLHPFCGKNGIKFVITGLQIKTLNGNVTVFWQQPAVDTQCTPGQDFDPAPLPAQTVVVSPADQATKAISWSYSIHWAEEPDVAWSSRWDQRTGLYILNAESCWNSIPLVFS